MFGREVLFGITTPKIFNYFSKPILDFFGKRQEIDKSSDRSFIKYTQIHLENS